MADPKKKVVIDGKEYDFTPGEGGSLLHQDEPTQPNIDVNFKRRAKVIGQMPQDEPQKFAQMKNVNGRQVFTK